MSNNEDTLTVSDTNKFVTSFFFSVTIGFLIIGCYILLQLFSTKTKAVLEPRINAEIKNTKCRPRTSRDISALPDSELMEYIGLDGIVFLLFIKSCIKICLFCTGIALIILIPIYANETRDIYDENDWIEIISISNLNEDSWRLWFSVIAAYIFTLLSLKILYDDGIYVATIVDQYLSNSHISHYTVMITDIPKQYQNQSNLYNLLQTVFPHKINKVYVVTNTKRITKLTKELHFYRKKLKHSKTKRIIVSYLPYPKYMDCAKYYRSKINGLKTELDYLLSTPKYGSTAFVNFNNLATTSCCVSTQIFANTLHFKCALAPYPKDLIRKNLYANKYDTFLWQTIINILILLIIFIWIVFINSSVILNNIEAFFQYMTRRNLNIYLSDYVIQLISGILPTIIIKIWLSLLPIMIESIYYKLSVCKDLSKLYLQILNKYYLCLIVMVLLSVVITQTVSNLNIFHIISVFQNIFETLALSLSKTSTLFIQYIMITAFILDPICLFYPIQYYIIDLFSFNNKNRQFDFVYFYANLSLELIITVTYSICSPLILFFSFIHFIMTLLIFKHLLITYFQHTDKTYSINIGRFVWIELLTNIIYGLYIPIMTFIGIVILKKAYYKSFALIILLLFILQIQNIIQINTKLSSSFKCVSLQTASKIDTQNQFKHLFQSEDSDQSNNYIQKQTQPITFEQCYISSYSNKLP